MSFAFTEPKRTSVYDDGIPPIGKSNKKRNNKQQGHYQQGHRGARRTHNDGGNDHDDRRHKDRDNNKSRQQQKQQQQMKDLSDESHDNFDSSPYKHVAPSRGGGSIGAISEELNNILTPPPETNKGQRRTNRKVYGGRNRRHTIQDCSPLGVEHHRQNLSQHFHPRSTTDDNNNTKKKTFNLGGAPKLNKNNSNIPPKKKHQQHQQQQKSHQHRKNNHNHRHSFTPGFYDGGSTQSARSRRRSEQANNTATSSSTTTTTQEVLTIDDDDDGSVEIASDEIGETTTTSSSTEKKSRGICHDSQIATIDMTTQDNDADEIEQHHSSSGSSESAHRRNRRRKSSPNNNNDHSNGGSNNGTTTGISPSSPTNTIDMTGNDDGDNNDEISVIKTTTKALLSDTERIPRKRSAPSSSIQSKQQQQHDNKDYCTPSPHDKTDDTDDYNKDNDDTTPSRKKRRCDDNNSTDRSQYYLKEMGTTISNITNSVIQKVTKFSGFTKVNGHQKKKGTKVIPGQSLFANEKISRTPRSNDEIEEYSSDDDRGQRQRHHTDAIPQSSSSSSPKKQQRSIESKSHHQIKKQRPWRDERKSEPPPLRECLFTGKGNDDEDDSDYNPKYNPNRKGSKQQKKKKRLRKLKKQSTPEVIDIIESSEEEEDDLDDDSASMTHKNHPFTTTNNINSSPPSSSPPDNNNSQSPGSFGSRTSLSVAKIAFGRKVYTMGCELKIRTGGPSPFISLHHKCDKKEKELHNVGDSASSAGTSSDDVVSKTITGRQEKKDVEEVETKILLNDGSIQEMVYYLHSEPEDSTTAATTTTDDPISFIALRVSPNTTNNLKFHHRNYMPDDTTPPDKQHYRYIVVELRSNDEFETIRDKVISKSVFLSKYLDENAMLKDDKGNGTMEYYTKALIKENQRDRENRLSSSSSTAANTRASTTTAADGTNQRRRSRRIRSKQQPHTYNIDGSDDNNIDPQQILLVYPFSVADQLIESTTEGLHEPKGESFVMKAEAEMDDADETMTTVENRGGEEENSDDASSIPSCEAVTEGMNDTHKTTRQNNDTIETTTTTTTTAEDDASLAHKMEHQMTTSNGGNNSNNTTNNNTNGTHNRTHYLTIRSGDYERLVDPYEYLNDTLIDFWMRWIWRKEKHNNNNNNNNNSQAHFFTTHFFTTLEKKGIDAVSSWTRKKQINVFTKTLVFIPVNESLHWSLCVVVNPGSIMNNIRRLEQQQQQGDGDVDDEEEEIMMKNRKMEMERRRRDGPNDDDRYSCILFFDSLSCHRASKVSKKVREWLNYEWNRLMLNNEETTTLHDYNGDNSAREDPFQPKTMRTHSPRIPYQDNSWDCGVYICRYAYALYQQRHQIITFQNVTDNDHNNNTNSTHSISFERTITDTPGFQFDAQDIVRLRSEMKTLVERLSELYLSMKKEEEEEELKKKKERRKLKLMAATAEKEGEGMMKE